MASVFVTVEIQQKGAEQIRDGTGASVRSGVEILLKNDLCFGQDEVVPPPDAVDAGPLVQEGLSMLVNYPFDALDISLESETVDVRKAYKRMALKYHPDKNPRTTPLFLAIQNAHERLTNMVDREEEEVKQKAAEAAAAAQAKKSKPPSTSRDKKPAKHTTAPQPGSQPDTSSSESADQQSDMNRRARKKAQQAEREERQKQKDEEEARRRAEEEEAERKEAEAWVFPIPSSLQVVCINASTVQLQWAPPPACAYTRPPSYLRTELGWRIVTTNVNDNQTSDDKVKPWDLTPLMRDQTEVLKDNLPAGKSVEFALRFFIQPTAENQGQIMRGEWCSPVSLTLPQSKRPPPSPKKSTVVKATESSASMYHRFLRTVSSLPNDIPTFDACKVDDDIVPDNWVSDEEDDSDVEDNTDNQPQRPTFQKTNSFRDMEVKWHQLMPPNSHMGNGGRYVHSVYSQSDTDSAVIGYVTTARKVQAKLRKGEWILVQAHAHSHCLGSTASASFSGFPWGWVQRSQWIESQQKAHIFLRPIPTSLKEVKKYKFLQSVHSMYSLREEDKSDLSSTQQTEVTAGVDVGGQAKLDDDGDDQPSPVYQEHAEEVVWYEQQDEATGSIYYYNGVTGESTWDAPQWVVEYDEFSGIRYFVKLDTQNATPLQSKWSMPPTAFSKLVRLQATIASS